MSAPAMASQLRAMPMRSTSSAASCGRRSPAVSVTTSGTPWICSVSATRSRVVPGMGVTMASSAPASALSRLLLPTLGWPASTTRRPSRSSAPWRVRCRQRSSAAWMPARRSRARAFSRKSISSSGKSSVASTSMRSSTSCAARPATSSENAPARERAAERAAASVWASMRSATASAWARSSLSFRKARSVNSPGSASLRPGMASRQRASSSCSSTGPPWACSSSTSSPV